MENKDQRYLDLARFFSTWSKDPSTGVGAVAIGTRGQVLAQGYNGFPRKVKESPERLNNREIKYQFVVHAEMNCIYNAGYNGTQLDGSTMYVYGLPVCNECAKGIIQVGIRRVVIPNEWEAKDVPDRWKISVLDTQRMFKEAGVIYDFI
jgi:dCMP deaminase